MLDPEINKTIVLISDLIMLGFYFFLFYPEIILTKRTKIWIRVYNNDVIVDLSGN